MSKENIEKENQEQKKEEERVKSKKKKIIRYVIIGILILIIVISASYVGIKLYTEHQEIKVYEDLAEYMKRREQKIKEQQNQVSEENVKTERMTKLEELHGENADIVAWIEIPDTNVNYPVLQSVNNDFYLRKNYKKEYSSTGSIFLDKDVDMELPSSNFLMYGHRNKGGAMFDNLIKYRDKSFYEDHKKIYFTTLKEEQEYEILAVFYSRVYYQNEKNVFRYYYFVNAETEEEYDDFVSNAKKVSIYDTGIDAKYGDQLMTLSTCEYSQEDGRFAVVAKRIK